MFLGIIGEGKTISFYNVYPASHGCLDLPPDFELKHIKNTYIYIYRENPFMVGPTFLIIAFLIRNPYRPVFNCHRYWVGGRSKLYIKLLECSLNDTPVTCRLKHMIIYDISSPSQSRFYDDVRLKMKVAKKRAVELSMDCETCYSSKISNHLHTIQATD